MIFIDYPDLIFGDVNIKYHPRAHKSFSPFRNITFCCSQQHFTAAQGHLAKRVPAIRRRREIKGPPGLDKFFGRFIGI